MSVVKVDEVPAARRATQVQFDPRDVQTALKVARANKPGSGTTDGKEYPREKAYPVGYRFRNAVIEASDGELTREDFRVAIRPLGDGEAWYLTRKPRKEA